MSSTTMDRLMVLVYVVDRGKKQIGVVGHALLQKLFYLLQAAKGVDLGYRFRLYYYGPYCSSLWSDLNLLQDYGLLTIRSNEKGYGYEIMTTDAGKEQIKKNESLTDNVKEKVGELLEMLGGESVRKLEALATAHFVYRDWKHKGLDAGRDQVIESVLSLKPHLTSTEVENALQLLEERGLLE